MLRIVYFGTPQFAVPFLERLHEDWRFDVVGVVAQPDAPLGRKKVLTPPPTARYAKDKKIPLFQPSTVKKNEEFLAELSTLNADLFVVYAYGQILPDRMLSMPRLGTVNVHPSKLPAYRGPTPIQSALRHGDSKTAISIMKIDAKMDHGPILAVRDIAIEPLDTYPDIEAKVSEVGPIFLADTILAYAEGTLAPVEQNHDAATYCKLLTRADGYIKPTDRIKDIWNMWRAYTPWPGITCMTEAGKKYKLVHMRPSPIATTCETLSFKVVGKGLLLCGPTGALEIELIQEEGRTAITGLEFIHGLSDSKLQIPLKEMS